MSDAASLSLSAKRIRRTLIEAAYHAPGDGAHLSPALSIADVMAVLYGAVLRYDPRDMASMERDVAVLSKGHAALALYAALAEFGVISGEQLRSFEVNGSLFQAHPTKHPALGIDFSGGSLSQGFGYSIGVAAGRRLRGEPWRTYVVVGDGECNEGAIWEGAAWAAHQGLANLTAVVDRNGLQSDGFGREILAIDLPAVWAAHGWTVVRCDGHSIPALLEAFGAPHQAGPKVVIADTVKGKGVSYMENNKAFHRNKLTPEQFELALAELSEAGHV